MHGASRLSLQAEVPLAQRLSSDDLPGPNAAFPYPLPMDPAQSSLSNMPLAVFYPAMLAFVGVAGLLGAGVGRALPGGRRRVRVWVEAKRFAPCCAAHARCSAN